MADEGYGRTFQNDPNPPPKPPQAPAVSSAPAVEQGGAGATAVAEAPRAAPTTREPVQIRAVESSEGFELYMATEDDAAFPMGRTRPVAGADPAAILRASGAWYNEEAKSWEGVPEDTAKALLKGRPGLTDYIIGKFKNGEAQAARNALGAAYLRGEIKREDALARGHEELLKVQLGEQPDIAWHGLDHFAADAINVLKHPAETLRFVAGEASEMMPYIIGGLNAAAKGATKGAAAGGAAAVAALATGPVGLPLAASVVSDGAQVGATYEAWKFFSDTEAGSTAMDMAEKGFDDKVIRDLAPLAGIIKGTLETASFGVMTAPLKRGFIKKLVESGPVKMALSKWYVTYAKTLGAEVTTELAQTRVDQVVNNYAAQIEEKPELLLGADKVKDELWATFVKTLAGTSVVGGAGAAVDAAVSVADAKAEAKIKAEGTEEKAARAQKVEAALTPIEAPKEEAAPAAPDAAKQPAGAEVVDPTGDYLPRAEKATAQVDDIIKKLNESDPTEAADKVEAAVSSLEDAPSYGEKVIEVERKALLETRRRELLTNQEQIRAKQAEITRLEKADMGTAVAVRQLDELTDKNADIRADIEFHTNIGPKNLMIEPNETLSMKPATLENVIELGFKEGRKEVLGTRRKAVLDVAKRLDLTQADLRSILKDKNYGTMGDVEFQNWLDDKFKPAAKEQFRRKVTLQDVRRKQAEKHLTQEVNVRRQNALPSVEKMDVQQMRDYMDLLDTFERGDKVLSPKRVAALQTTDYAGARTMGEVAKRAKQLWGYPADTMVRLLPEPSIRPDITRGMDRLAARSPAHKAMVQITETAIEAEDMVYMAEREKLFELGAKALASRKGIAGRVIDPTMPEVMAHLEADAGQVYAGQVNLPTLTPEEETLVNYIDDVYAKSLSYLEAVDGLKSRFAGKYFTHAKRGVLEIIGDMKDAGVKKTLKELYESLTPTVINFSTAKGGKNVGLRAHMKQTMFRTGEMKPSKNVLRVVDGYLRAFHKKKALDRAVPQVDTIVDAAIWLDKDKTKEGEARKAAFDEFIADYLTQKKGQTILARAVPHGGLIDVTLRTMMALPSWAWIAFNPKLQVAAKLGEIMPTIPLLGPVGLANAWRLRFTEQGQKILAANEGFTGTPIVKRIMEPGKDLSEISGLAMYGILQMHRVHTMQDVLLGSLTKEEIESGKVSAERLAEIKVAASRWIDVKGAKSVLGATSPGAMLTQFKGWALPILETTLEDHVALLKSMAGQEKMTEVQKTEMMRLYTTGVVVTAVGAMVAQNVDEDDDSWTAQFLKGLHRELFSITGGANPFLVFGAPPAITFYFRLIKALEMTWKRERYETGDHEGELKGPRALARLAPGRSLARQLGMTEEQEK